MDARAEVRVEADEPVVVTRLGPGRHPPFPGWIQNFSRRGMGLRIAQPLALSTPLKVEWGRMMVLGEVSHCSRSGTNYLVGLELAHTIFDTEELARLANRLLEEGSASGDTADAADRRALVSK
ncbi:MAG: PilZ domain-containing protein [Bryobacteraceae bacterium]